MKINDVMQKHDQWEERRRYIAERGTYRDFPTSKIYNALDSFVKTEQPHQYDGLRSAMVGRSMSDLRYLSGSGIYKMRSHEVQNMFKLSAATLHRFGYLHSSHTAAGLVGKALRNIGMSRDDKLYGICTRFAKRLENPGEIVVELNESC